MKKILLIILLFLTTNLIAQREFGSPQIYDSVLTLNYNSTLQVRYQNQTKIITWWRLKNLLGSNSTLLSSDNSWTGLNSFSDQITLPASLDPDLVNGIGFNSGEFAWSDGNGDSLFYGASKSWVLALLAAEGIAGDLSAYATKAGSNAFSGQNTFTNVNNFINGTLYLPVKNSYSAFAGNQQGFINSTNGKVMFQTKDGSNNKYDLTMASEAWVTANFSQVTGFALASGSQTLNPIWTFNGTINAIGGKLKIKESTTLESNEVGFETTQGSAGIYVGSSVYVPADNEVQDMIDKTINLSPTTMVSSVINLETANRFYYSGNSNVTFTFTNMKQTSFELFIATQGITMNLTAPSGYTIDWVGAVEQPSEQGDYKYVFEVWGTVIKVYLAYKDQL